MRGEEELEFTLPMNDAVRQHESGRAIISHSDGVLYGQRAYVAP